MSNPIPPEYNGWAVFWTVVGSGSLIQLLNWITGLFTNRDTSKKTHVDVANSNVDMALKLRDEAAESFANMQARFKGLEADFKELGTHFKEYSEKAVNYISYLEGRLEENHIKFDKTKF